jgi:phosphoglycerate dehydrogenase-like enzyme
VSITPHNSATSTGQLRRQEELFFDNLARLLADEPLRGVVTVADLD